MNYGIYDSNDENDGSSRRMSGQLEQETPSRLEVMHGSPCLFVMAAASGASSTRSWGDDFGDFEGCQWKFRESSAWLMTADSGTWAWIILLSLLGVDGKLQGFWSSGKRGKEKQPPRRVLWDSDPNVGETQEASCCGSELKSFSVSMSVRPLMWLFDVLGLGIATEEIGGVCKRLWRYWSLAMASAWILNACSSREWWSISSFRLTRARRWGKLENMSVLGRWVMGSMPELMSLFLRWVFQ